MSNVNTTYADFSITDYKNSSLTLSSYNLSLTPFTFTPIIPTELGENTYVVWDFGDTTSSKELVSTHFYKTPGTYTVKLFVYDRYNQAVRANISKIVTVRDYIEDTFNIATGYNLSLSCGKISTAINITQTLPYYYTDSTINYNVSGANTRNYFNLDNNKYNHLSRYNALLSKEYIPSSNSYELVELKSINLPLTAIYIKLVNTTLQTSLTSDSTTILAGFSAVGSVYYRDDLPTSRFNLSFSRRYNNIVNSFNITLSGKVNENTNSSKLTITSNGLDGDSEPLSSFNINSVKFNNTKIHFVIKLKDSANNTIKNINPFILSSAGPNAISITLNDSNGPLNTSTYTISSLQSTLTGLSSGGYFRGYVEYTDTLTLPITGVSLSAIATNIVTITGGSLASAAGSSTSFSIYPYNYYDLYKKGEDFDGEATYKSLRFQESLLDKDKFFGDFLGSIFGGSTPDSEALSKKVNERISNFTDNTVNVDTAEVVRLLSMSQMLDNANTIFDQNLSNFPNKIQRLVSLLSIKKSKLFGIQNKFVENFNSLGRVTKDVYGKNLGDKIDPYTYAVVPGTPIVAYEKFSRQYTLLNTYQPLLGNFSNTYVSTETDDIITTESLDDLLTETFYSIVDYNDTWGWPLVLPTNFTQDDIPLYYDFYTFNSVYADDYVGGVLDMNLTNVTPDDVDSSESIYNTIILDTLYQSLSLTPN